MTMGRNGRLRIVSLYREQERIWRGKWGRKWEVKKGIGIWREEVNEKHKVIKS